MQVKTPDGYEAFMVAMAEAAMAGADEWKDAINAAPPELLNHAVRWDGHRFELLRRPMDSRMFLQQNEKIRSRIESGSPGQLDSEDRQRIDGFVRQHSKDLADRLRAIEVDLNARRAGK